MILLDTNVLSEITRPKPAPAVLAWLDDQVAETLFISSVTIAELMFGIGLRPKGRRRQALTTWVEGVAETFAARTLPFDAEAARFYADLAVQARLAGRGFPVPVGYIAAIAAQHNFAVASRDDSAFAAAGLRLIDPWTAEVR